MGVVYHTHFLDYFEAARTEALRTLGLAYKTVEAQGISMPVIDLAVQYKRPAYYDDVLDITTCFADVPSTRIRLDYDVHRVGETVLLPNPRSHQPATRRSWFPWPTSVHCHQR